MSKFCGQCGTQNPDEGRFCRNCGAPLADIASKEDTVTKEGAVSKEGQGEKRETGYKGSYNRTGVGKTSGRKPGKPLNKKLIIGLGAAAAAVIVIILLVLNMGKTLNLTDYIDISYEGPSGYATPHVDIDLDKLYADGLAALGYSQDQISSMGYGGDFSYDLNDIMNMAGNYSKIMQDANEVDAIRRYMDVELDKTENVSNGDKITATVTYSRETNRLHVKGGEKTFEVTGLMEVQDIDPFGKIKITFSGVEPYGVAVMEGTEAYEDFGFYYSMDKDSGLSEGDQVTVTVSYDETSILEKGYHVTSNTKVYTVEKLDDASAVDVFEGVNVLYEGAAPFANAYLEEYSKYIPGSEGGYDIYVSFEIENPEGLDIGDTVKVKASYNIEDFTRNGMVPAAEQKEYTVEGVDNYIRNPSEVSEELMRIIKHECQDKLDAYLAGLSGSGFTHSGETTTGSYILTRKPTNDSWDSVNNCMFLLFKGYVRSTEENSGIAANTPVVYAFRIDSLIKHLDGSQTYDEGSLQMVDVNNPDITVGWENLDAYSDMEAAYTDLVVKNKDGYTAEESDKAKESRETWSSSAAPAPEPEVTAAPTPEATPEPTPEATPEPTPEATPEPTPEATPAPDADAPQESSHEGEVAIQYGIYAPASDFIFPESSVRNLSYEEIDAALQDADQNTRYRNGQLAINEILARYGYNFNPESERIGARDAAAKFGGMSWYQEAKTHCAYDDPNNLIAAMNGVEKANIKAITDWQYANDAAELK